MHGRAADPEIRGIFYGAPSLECCILEVCGELGVVNLDNYLLLPEVTASLTLLDLRAANAPLAGAPPDIGNFPLRPQTQEWSRFIYETPAMYAHVDGLLYTARHGGTDTYALYERCESRINSPGHPPYMYPLSHPLIREHILDIANRWNLVVLGP
jgi:hypothetical protein